MTMYKNEKAFKKAIMGRFKTLGYECTIVETGNTEVGVPDLYVETPARGYWVELKREHVNLLNTMVTIHWRPGQQAWAIRQYRASGGQRPTLTIVAFNNCIASIAMDRLRASGTIVRSECLNVWGYMHEVKL